ncbi:MAG TPA: GNAT family N-acetyltransferase [Bacillus sp. (in: firmicutes)]|nr:GNAT family N-acetyltransferase [Bacillus sp. (in: firmicutes)]
MENVNIRLAAYEDISQLFDLMNQYIVDFYKCPRPSEDSLKGLITHLLDHPYEGTQFVAEKAPHELVGFSTLYFTFNTLEVKRMAILHDLFVLPNMRGQKVGEKMIQTCLSYVRDNDYSHMIWETAHDNFAAQSLYDKIGAKKAAWLNYEMK